MSTPSSPNGSGGQAGAHLNGWKDIAAYLGRGVRTVQRWEKERGLPVHRVGIGRGESTHAFTGELDEWLRTVGAPRDSDDEPGNGAAEATPGAAAAGADATSGADSASASDSAARAAGHGAARRWPRRRVAYLAGTCLFAVLLLAIVVRPWLGPPKSATVGQPHGFKVDVDTLIVLDVNQNEVFRLKFPRPLPPATYYETNAFGRRRLLIEDFDGDGSREVVLFVPSESHSSPVDLVWIDHQGTVRFTWHVDRSVRFGAQDFAPPWEGHALFVTGQAGRRQLWAAWVHVQSGFFPCVLQRLSPRLQPLSEYWSAGYVESVEAASVEGVPSILVGAANNDHKGASLAVFPADRVQGSAPAESPDKVCANCPPGGPTPFLVFPRLESMEQFAFIPSVYHAAQQATGEFRVWVNQQGHDAAGHQVGGPVYYDLSAELVPIRAGLSDAYIAAHRAAEAGKWLDHPFGDRDWQQLWPVLVAKGNRFDRVTAQTDR